MTTTRVTYFIKLIEDQQVDHTCHPKNSCPTDQMNQIPFACISSAYHMISRFFLASSIIFINLTFSISLASHFNLPSNKQHLEHGSILFTSRACTRCWSRYGNS
ncbi:hypothetical protein PsorP6_011285 [Peronosclerospora sorghi]|uniref:Uncharacterized protein n=1 Tax=Peronosclerospora sorghi TaxID=230839 RepID=A0ACC0WJ41_9STRA|nr:hypothetical protein PsorP6_011285 [Peronosclerospora sorghi]